MGKSRTKTSVKSTRPKSSASGLWTEDGRLIERRAEALGIVSVVLAVALCFALFSFDPGDLSGKRNLVGPVGALLARLLFQGLGVIGYLAVTLPIVFAFLLILGRAGRPSLVAIISFFGVVWSSAVIAGLVFRGAQVFGYPPGGSLGLFSGALLQSFVGPVGAALFALGVLFLGVLGLSWVSPGQALRDLARSMVWFGRSRAPRTLPHIQGSPASRTSP